MGGGVGDRCGRARNWVHIGWGRLGRIVWGGVLVGVGACFYDYLCCLFLVTSFICLCFLGGWVVHVGVTTATL